MTAPDTRSGSDVVRLVIDDAGMPDDGAKPRLLVEDAAPDRTVAALRDLLSTAGKLFDRGLPVRLASDKIRDGLVAQILTPDVLVLLAHRICRPFALKQKHGAVEEVDVRLPRNIAVMYLDWRGEWQLPPLNGIASAPLLEDTGVILSAEGYDETTGLWRERVPDLRYLVRDRPSREDAEAALRLLRHTFRTFCFADATSVVKDGMAVVDLELPPAKDESAFLAALLTAVCRPSLHHAPGILFRAAPLSGAGAGKGLLARCIALIAFGREPHAVTGGGKVEELEKRITAELVEGSPVLFLDNLNNLAFRSDLLASAITERPARVRILGRSLMLPLNSSALIVLTGNGLTLSEDLARRFITVELDPRTEDPESRRFTGDIRAEVTKDRTRLLAAALTIWRWGRQADCLPEGRPLGSFETWCRWVRDPLLALGCVDPVERISETKEQDGRRQTTADLFNTWWARHADRPIRTRDLHEDVRHLIDPQGRGRQFIGAQLGKLVGTRLAGFVMTRQATDSNWGVATFSLVKVPPPDGGGPGNGRDPVPPYAPYAFESDTRHKGGCGVDVPDTPNPNTISQVERHRGHRGHRGAPNTTAYSDRWRSADSGERRFEEATPYASDEHPDHRGHRAGIGGSIDASGRVEKPQETADPLDSRSAQGPMPPMPPMPSGSPCGTDDDEPSEGWSDRI